VEGDIEKEVAQQNEDLARRNSVPKRKYMYRKTRRRSTMLRQQQQQQQQQQQHQKQYHHPHTTHRTA
jgi:hypothetical protein